MLTENSIFTITCLLMGAWLALSILLMLAIAIVVETCEWLGRVLRRRPRARGFEVIPNAKVAK